MTRCAIAALLIVLPMTAALGNDVPHQSLAVQYDPAKRSIGGRLEVTLTPQTGTVYFLLLPNLASEPNPYVSNRVSDAAYPFGFEPALLTVESVTLAQSPSETALPFRLLAIPPALQTYSLEATILAIDVSTAGDRPTLRIEFTTEAPRTSSGDGGVTADILTWRFGWYPILLNAQEEIVEEAGTIRYRTSDAFPLVFPRGEMEATVSAPVGMVFLSGADRVEHVSVPEDPDEPAQYSARFTSPTRSFAVTIGAGYEIFHLDGPTPIEVAYLEGHEEEARLFATYAREILAHYEERFGPYPRERLTIVENPNRIGTAFAADGILWLPRQVFTHRNVLLSGILNRFIEYVLAHEIAHQWFGLGTGVDLDTDAWLSEGLAQYASISYFETRHGATNGNLFEIVGQGFLEELIDRQVGFMNLREHQVELPYLFTLWSGFDEAIVKPTREVQYANADVVRLYDKGYLVARAIAANIGEEAFDRALRTAFEETRASQFDANGFRRFLEAEAGLPLGEVFSAWVFGDATVDYTAKITAERKTETGHETTVTVTREGGAPQPVDVEVTLSSGAIARQTWDGGSPEETLIFQTPSPIRRVTIDPEHRLPDSNRLNNNDPIKIVTAIDRAVLPLDSYVLSPSPSSGGFSFGWLDRFLVTVQENKASMIVNEGRHHQYAGAVSIEGGRLTGSVAYTYTSYHRPETGSPATYWEPDVALTIGARRLYSGDEPVWALQLSALDLSSIRYSHVKSVALEIAEEGATRFALYAFDEIRLLPQLYLQGAGSLGFSVGGLPAPLRFSFDELRTSGLSPERNKLTGIISLDLATESAPYNIVNLAMIDRNRTRLFVAGGLGWTTLEDFGKTGPNLEAGVEQVVELSTLGGLLPLVVRLGIATPVIGPGVTVVYAEISL